MSTPTQPQTGADVMAQFIPSSPFVAKLGIVADVLDADEVRLRLPWDPTNVTIADMVHGGAIAALADVAVMAASCATRHPLKCSDAGPSPVATYDPYQCSDPYLCTYDTYDTYDPLIVIDPD